MLSGRDSDFLIIANEAAHTLDMDIVDDPWLPTWDAETLWVVGTDAFEALLGPFTSPRRMTFFLSTQVSTIAHLGLVFSDSDEAPKRAPRYSPDPCFPDTSKWPAGGWLPAFMAGRIPINELDETLATAFPDDTQAARDATLPTIYKCFQERAGRAFLSLKRTHNVSLPPLDASFAPDSEDESWLVKLGFDLPVGLLVAAQIRVDTGARVHGGASLDSSKAMDIRALWNAVITSASDGGGTPGETHIQSDDYAVIIEPTADGMSILVTAWRRDEAFTAMAAFTESVAQRLVL